MKEPKEYNYKYYEKQSTDAFVTADETQNNARAQLFLLDTIARSLSVIADALEYQNGTAAPKEVDYDCGLVEEDSDDNG